MKVQIMEKKLENFKNGKMIINYHNGSGSLENSLDLG